MAERNWGSNSGATTGATTGARTAYEGFAKNYNGAFLVSIGLAMAITFFEVMFSRAGGAWSIVNYWIGWSCLATWAFLVFHPKGPGPVLFLAVMGFNAPWNELDDILTKLKLPDFKLKEMGEKGWQFLRMKYFVLAGHVALYLVLQSMVLATFDVSHGALVPGILLGFAGFGLWAALLTKAVVWYARIVFLTLFVTTGYAIAGTFAPEPSETEVIAAEVREMSDANLDKGNAKQIEALKKFVKAGGVLSPEQHEMIDRVENETAKGPVRIAEKFIGDMTYRKDIIHTFSSFDDTQICGIKSGKRTFRVQGGQVEVWANNTLTGSQGTMRVTNMLRFNGAALDQPATVGKSECVKIRFEGLSPTEKAAINIRGGSIPFIIE